MDYLLASGKELSKGLVAGGAVGGHRGVAAALALKRKKKQDEKKAISNDTEIDHNKGNIVKEDSYMSDYELLQLLEECEYEPSDENLQLLKEDNALLEDLLLEARGWVKRILKGKATGSDIAKSRGDGGWRLMAAEDGHDAARHFGAAAKEYNEMSRSKTKKEKDEHRRKGELEAGHGDDSVFFGKVAKGCANNKQVATESYSDYELLQMLDECDYEPSDENLQLLKEDTDLMESFLTEARGYVKRYLKDKATPEDMEKIGWYDESQRVAATSLGHKAAKHIAKEKRDQRAADILGTGGTENRFLNKRIEFNSDAAEACKRLGKESKDTANCLKEEYSDDVLYIPDYIPLDEELSEYQIMQILDENGFEVTDEDVALLKEGLTNGELAIVEEEILTEGRDIADEKTGAQVVLRGNENRFVRRYIKRTYKRKLKALKKKEKDEKKRLKRKKRKLKRKEIEDEPVENNEGESEEKTEESSEEKKD